MDFSKSRLCPKDVGACGLFRRSSQDHKRVGDYVGHGAHSTGPGGVGDPAQRTSAPAREGWPVGLSPALPRRLKVTSEPAGLSAGTRHSQAPGVGRHRVGRGDHPPRPQWAPQPRAQGTWDREDGGPPALLHARLQKSIVAERGPGASRSAPPAGQGRLRTTLHRRSWANVGEGVGRCSSVADKGSGFSGTAGDRARGAWGRT